jgi:uncharacterized protein YfeS
MTNDRNTLATPHPAFAQHFSDPLYDSSGDEFAPFGSDEGSDLLATWAERRAELDETSTLARVLGCEPDAVATYAGPMDGIDGLETAMFITSAAFVQLRLTGHINEPDRQQALDALDFQINTGPLPETPASLVTQRRDLGTWRNPD